MTWRRRLLLLSTTVRRTSALRGAAIGLAVLLTPLAAAALDNVNNTGTVDCGDQSTKDACFECCTTLTCIGKIVCCPLVGPCTIVNKASGSTSFPSLKLSEIAGGLKLQFERKGNDTGVDVKVKASFLKKVFPKPTSFRVHLTGRDARLAGLLYPVAFLGSGTGALAMLQAHGYDVAVTDVGTFPTCQELLPAQLCTDLAYALSKSIGGALGVGFRDELIPFLDGAAAIGYAPCSIIF